MSRYIIRPIRAVIRQDLGVLGGATAVRGKGNLDWVVSRDAMSIMQEAARCIRVVECREFRAIPEFVRFGMEIGIVSPSTAVVLSA